MQYDTDMVSPHRELFLKAREFLLAIEDITETRKPRITTYANTKGGICHMRTMPHGIDFGFLKGARMTDIHSRLTGNGKAIRVLSLSKFDENLVDYYLRQAIALNQR